MLQIQRWTLLFPLLIASLPIVFMAAKNSEQATVLQVASVLAVVWVATLLMTLLLRVFIKDSPKVAAIVIILLLIFFSFGHIHDLIKGTTIAGFYIGRLRYLMLLAAMGGLGGIWAVLRYQGNLAMPLQCLALVVLVLIGFNLGGALFADIQTRVDTKARDREVNFPTADRAQVGELPDIYYIILDAYGRGDVLKEVHGFDNHDFLDFLNEQNFYVASSSRTNYVFTALSIPSSLNMRYLTDEDQMPGPLLKNNEVMQFARSLGYKIVFPDSGWFMERAYLNADLPVYMQLASWRRALINDFSAALLQSTPARLLGPDKLYIGTREELFHHNVQTLWDMPEAPEPTFTFAHFMQPHDPYIFDREGRVRTPVQADTSLGEVDLYIDQLIYVNKEIELLVQHILTTSANEPIIIIQSDHGPKITWSVKHASSRLDEGINDLVIFERTGILNAYYLPGKCSREGLYPSISPVNSFRVVFDSCLGANFDLLEDKSYFFRQRRSPYGFLEVDAGSP